MISYRIWACIKFQMKTMNKCNKWFWSSKILRLHFVLFSINFDVWRFISLGLLIKFWLCRRKLLPVASEYGNTIIQVGTIQVWSVTEKLLHSQLIFDMGRELTKFNNQVPSIISTYTIQTTKYYLLDYNVYINAHLQCKLNFR